MYTHVSKCKNDKRKERKKKKSTIQMSYSKQSLLVNNTPFGHVVKLILFN
jgi:hypothetical protein